MEISRENKDFKDIHNSILERIIPPEGLLLPQNPCLKHGTTGLCILIYKFDDSNPVDIPGEIASVYPDLEGVFSNSLVLKIPGKEKHPYFANTGSLANKTLLFETAVDQRVLREGLIPSALGNGRIEERGDRVVLFPDSEDDDDLRPAPSVMPYYDETTEFGTAINQIYDPEDRRRVMQQAVALEFAYERPMPEEFRDSCAGLAGIRSLTEVTFQRALSWYQGGEKTQEVVEAAEVFQQAYNALLSDSEFRDHVKEEARKGHFLDVHGDLRPYDNANIITTRDGDPLIFFRDPPRLFRLDNDSWTDFHLTHRDFQLGLMIGRLLTEGYCDLVKYGIREHQKRSNGVNDWLSIPDLQMKSLGTCYALFVDILVAHGQIQQGIYTGPPVELYWNTVSRIAERKFLGLEEVL